MFSKIITVVSLLAAAVHAVDHVIVVGENSTLTFNPNSIQAAVGDTVQFQFVSKNHTIQQSSFQDPCDPLTGGFSEGFNQVVLANATVFPTITIQVNTTDPLWVQCPQKNPSSHCQQGMVFAINANAAHTFAQFQANAINSGNSTSSGNGTSSSSGSSGSNSSSTDGSSSTKSGAMQVQLTGVVGLLAAVGSAMLLL